MDREVAKKLAGLRELIAERMRTLNEYTDVRDDAIEDSVDETQVGLAETFETTVASQEEITNTQVALAEIYEMIIGGE